ncbi:hypothetical protein [Listeria costaricensis]|uniref:hypothetical protein n=1 Tax=Listeria costaricensis TaxID=2026604 RepID=UPI000C07CE74|nr:hypothetical protein [Listeria costaricensis]
MRIDTWEVSVYIKYTPIEVEAKTLTIETIGKNLATAINSAKSKVICSCKKAGISFMKVALLDFKHIGYTEKSTYDVFADLKYKNMKQKSIMKHLKITFGEYKFFNDYFEGRTRKLTASKYRDLKHRLSDEQIRKKFKIPRIEFSRFLKAL